MAEFTECLRREAPNWSLGGDKQLLEVLKGFHKKIIEKCQETNRNLENMVFALDEASIHLQNVNNKFTALSNSQFVESRVYDDDAEETPVAEKPKVEEVPKASSEMEYLKRSLEVLESMHERVTIMCDSDSDSGSDGDGGITRVVLKPKDLYADRPLPYIIGSHAWRTKWHVGLVPDDSDSDSTSIKNTGNVDEYSDSEPEPGTESPHYHKHNSPSISSSSGLESEQDHPVVPTVPRSQADVAAELARRLGGATFKLPEPEPSPPSPVVRKLHKPHQPAPGNIFLDEPPPLDSDQSADTEEDIFAEINKNQPYNKSVNRESSVADDLFGRPVFDEVPPANPLAIQKPLLFLDESEPELFADKPKVESGPMTASKQKTKEDYAGVKKPVGGMSLFGSNANAKSIGAAILKRNQRRSSTSGEESDQERPQINNTPKKEESQEERGVETQRQRERDIFEDLFAKSERINKEINKNKVAEEKQQPAKVEKKTDLFSDNIFDDIDDIFTSNIKVVSKDEKKTQKSIFDDDDDDLFSEIDKNKKDNSVIESKNTRGVFDSDDIFKNKPEEIKIEPRVLKNNDSIKETKSIFDDSDDDIFSDNDKTKTSKNLTLSVNTSKRETQNDFTSISSKTDDVKNDLFSKDEELFKVENKHTKSDIKENINDESPKALSKPQGLDTANELLPSKFTKSPDLFDDDDDSLFLFQSAKSQVTEENLGNKSVSVIGSHLQDPEIDYKPKPAEAVKDNFSDIKSHDSISTKPQHDEKYLDNYNDPNVNVIQSKPVEDCVSEDKDKESVKTVISTTVTKAKPNIAVKPTIEDVTVISAKITIKPASEIERAVSQSVTVPDPTSFGTKITDKPDVSNETLTSPDVIVEETKVFTPSVAQKPVIPQKEKPSEEFIDNSIPVLDNMIEVDANKNIRDPSHPAFDAQTKLTVDKKLSYPSEMETDTNKDLFSDDFADQPPVFEKPKEPKRSKNVNALFDDDSDDESLFFKKNDVIVDEKPEGFVPSDDRLFGLFRDEPPAIDVDFVQKSNEKDRGTKTDVNLSKKLPYVDKSSRVDHKPVIINQGDATKTEIDDKLFKTDDISSNYDESLGRNLNDDDIFASSSTKTKSLKTVAFPEDIDNKDLFSNVTEEFYKKQDDDDNFKTPEKVSKNISSEDENEIGIQEKPENANQIDNSSEPKKIGKLKSMNISINVNTLLPGASPKKVVKTKDQTDGQITSKSNDELHKDDLRSNVGLEPKVVKSINFEENPDPGMLDNKLSKERPKIQVKRRPSTRRARREAVKKSGIDFGEDSTDNSNSIDDQPKIQRSGADIIIATHEDHNLNPEEKNKIPDTEQNINVDSENDDIPSGNKGNIYDNNAKACKQSPPKDTLDLKDDSDVILSAPKSETQKENDDKSIIETKSSPNNSVKSKVVYILNDEDIFDTKNHETTNIVVKETIASEQHIKHTNKITVEDPFDDPDDLFKSMTKTKSASDGITTLGQVYNNPKLKTIKNDLFSDSDDENLFKTSRTTTKVVELNKEIKEEKVSAEMKNKVPFRTDKAMFDDEENDDLFKGKKSIKEVKKVSLFGSDSDEELFGGKKKENKVPVKKQEPKKEEMKRLITKSSLFDDDSEDGDLFGVKTKQKEEPKPVSKAASAKDVSKGAELVFDDPLSLLESDDE